MNLPIFQRCGMRRRCSWMPAVGVLVAVFGLSYFSFGADWPTWRHDAARSGITPESPSLPLSLSTAWTFQPVAPPRPAWTEPNPRKVGGWYGLLEGPRLRFDEAPQTAVAGGLVVFGSSSTGVVRALDAATGRPRWRFITDGPVRLAPTIAGDRVYVGSDDGYVYCLNLRDGALVWKFRAGPADDMLLGNGAMISRWPVRTGVLVDDGIAYFCAGIFPTEGVMAYALNVDDGKLVWRNDRVAAPGMNSRFSPQGYLLASPEFLYVPQGRVPPAALDRKTGRLAWQTYVNHHVGGTFAVLADGQLFTGTNEIVAMDRRSPNRRLAWFWARRVVVDDKRAWLAGMGRLQCLDWMRYGQASLQRAALLDQLPGVQRDLRAAQRRKDKAAIDTLQKRLDDLLAKKKKLEDEMAACALWRANESGEGALIKAGNVLFVGGKERVAAYDADKGDRLWQATAPGRILGLAFADGRLYAASDTGRIVCFAPGAAQPVVRSSQIRDLFADSARRSGAVAAARRMCDLAGVRKGYALVVGLRDGALAYALAKTGSLQVIAVDADAERVRRLREAFEAAGMYGARIVVHCFDLSRLPYSDWFANIVTSELAVSAPPGAMGAALQRLPRAGDLYRFIKPWGGMLVLGRNGAANAADADALKRWFGKFECRVSADEGVWAVSRRGSVPGAGTWSHLYAEPGNTTCSDDELVRSPLGLLWFGGPGPDIMVDRHRRVSAPVAADGRVYVEGFQNITAWDACNAVQLWRRDIPGVTRTGVSMRAGNLVAGPDCVFVAVGDKCLQLDGASGKTVREFRTPPESNGTRRPWGWVAYKDGRLYGSAALSARNSNALFAYAADKGQLLWRHEARSVIESSIAAAEGRVFYVDAAVSPQERDALLKPRLEAAAKLKGDARATEEARIKAAKICAVAALDAGSGRVLWRKIMDLTGCMLPGHYVTLGAIAHNGVLLLFGVYTDGHFWNEFYAGQFDQRHVIALSAGNGRVLWEKNIGYRVRPVVIGNKLVAEPWMFDLRTGARRERAHPVTGRKSPWTFARPGHHCGCPGASPHMLFFRSWSLGWYDLDSDTGTTHFGVQRTGCWINFLPANGLLLAPEGSSGCMCAFPVQTSIALKTRKRGPTLWTVASGRGPVRPVKSAAFNFGAPGDRRDASGRLWLGIPRPGGNMVLQFPIDVGFYPGGTWQRPGLFKAQATGTPDPWLFSCAAQGVRRIEIPCLGEEDGPSLYRITLGLMEPEADAKPGVRVFDVLAQGKVVPAAVDPVREAGAPRRVVWKTIDGVRVDRKLSIEFRSKAGGKPPLSRAPVVYCMRIERVRVLSPGMAAPDYLVSDAAPEQTKEVLLTNDMAETFEGVLRIETPSGFNARPSSLPITLRPGERRGEKVAVRADVPGKPADLKIRFALVGKDGKVAIEKTGRLESLGPRHRITVTAVEDAYVRKGQPGRSYARDAVLNVDGGNAQFGDEAHSLAYIRFRFPKITGKTLAVRLRMKVSDNPGAESGNAGHVCLVDGPWQETTVTYAKRPKTGRELVKIGRVARGQFLEFLLPVDLNGKEELSVVIEPLSNDGVGFYSRESGFKPVLVIDYEPAPQPPGGRPQEGQQPKKK